MLPAQHIAEHLNYVKSGVDTLAQATMSSTTVSVQKTLSILEEFQIKGIKLLVDYGPKIVISILLLWISLKLIHFICKRLEKLLNKRKVDVSLIPFIVSVTSVALKILVILTVISIIGIPMTSFVALIGAIGLAIGMAFSGTLSNVAGGVVLLVLRPFKVGDYIAAQGFEGTVQVIQIFTTIIVTADNKVISIPNGPLSTGTITNYSAKETRRLDVKITMAHGVNTTQVSDDMMEIIKADKRIFEMPSPAILTELADGTVTLTLRFWVTTKDYWSVDTDFKKQIYQYLCDKNIKTPYTTVALQK